MYKPFDSRAARARRHRRLRKRLAGTQAQPRLNVFRSLKHIYAQVIDDSQGFTLAAACSNEPSVRDSKSGDKTAQAKSVGALIAERAKAKGIGKVVFDRGGYMYHGRVKALADAARESGLQF